MANPKSNKKAIASTGPPVKKNAFARGDYKGSPLIKKNKDNRHVMIIEGMQNGVMTAYLKKANKEEEPFLAHDMILFNNDPNLCESFGINTIIPRKGVNGETPLKQNPNSSYDWRQFVFILGEEGNNSVNRRSIANALIDHLNGNAVIPNYQYPIKVKFGWDKTTDPMRTISENMLDSHVLQMMKSAYPDTNFGDLLTDVAIISTFWADVDHGSEIMMQHYTAGDFGVDGDENDN